MKPMLCNQGQPDERFDPDVWATEAKFDGWRLLCHRRDSDVRVVAGRNGSDYTGQLPRVERALANILPADSIVDGEIVATNGWGGVQHAMRTGAVHEGSDLMLVIFDVIQLDGHDMRALPWKDRRWVLDQLRVEQEAALDRSPIFPTAPTTLDVVLANGFEGLVLKRKSSRYVNGRSPFWVKVKPQQTAEAIVTGFKPGNGSFAGLVGALEFKMLDTGAQSRCSGFDMRLREQITANPQDWLGTVIEIKHHGLGREGKPRHPQFLRRRDDRTCATTVPTPTNPRRRAVSTTARMRNYAAMKDAKLLLCVEQLRAQAGDAYDRVVSKGGDPAADLAVASAEAEQRGL